MIGALSKLIAEKKIQISKNKLPKHLAVATFGSERWAASNNKSLAGALRNNDDIILQMIHLQKDFNIPIMTLLLSPSSSDNIEEIAIVAEYAHEMLESIRRSDLVHRHSMKVSVFGKWYNMPSRTIDLIKTLIQESSDYDKFFLNICLNYDGQTEIVDACKIVARKVQAGKLDPESIDKGIIKEEIYTSYFIAPEYIIATGRELRLNGFLLWDSASSKIHFVGKDWPDFDIRDFLTALEAYQRHYTKL